MLDMRTAWRWWILFLIIVLGFVGWMHGAAHARDSGQWTNTDPEIASWYRSLMQPDNPLVPCCGESDAYWADKVEVIDGKTYVTITDDRDDLELRRPHVEPGTKIEVPPNKLTWKKGNPTGHVIIFLGPDLQVYCLVLNGGV